MIFATKGILNERPKQPQQYLTPEQQAALAAHRKTVDDLVEYGRTAHGADSFDTASQIVADKLGNEQTQLLVAAPPSLIARIA